VENLDNKGRCNLATVSADQELIDIIASEIAIGVNAAVEGWMSQLELILRNPHLTTLGRLQAIQEVVARYRSSTVLEGQAGCGDKRLN
jgi:hypothetical protein